MSFLCLQVLVQDPIEINVIINPHIPKQRISLFHRVLSQHWSLSLTSSYKMIYLKEQITENIGITENIKRRML
jgi:hypothetical protein